MNFELRRWITSILSGLTRIISSSILSFSAYVLDEVPVDPIIGLIFRGSFLNEHYDTNSTNKMIYFLSLHHKDGTYDNITDFAHLPVVTIPEMDSVKELKRSTTIELEYAVYQKLVTGASVLKLNLITDFDASLPVNFAYDPSPLDQKMGLIYATIVLLGLYVMIIWELVHRTFAAIIASTMSIGEIYDENSYAFIFHHFCVILRYSRCNESTSSNDTNHVVD